VTGTLLALVPVWGLWLVAGTTLASCLALPIPASLMMLAAGGFAAAGDLVLWQVAAAALGGAVAGDQLGYLAGRSGGARVLSALARDGTRRVALDKAAAMMAARGAGAVFLTRWLLSPLGPWVNLTAGSLAMSWPRFTLAGLAGEAVWVGLYTGIGHVFGGNLQAASAMAGSVLGFLAAGAVALALGWWLAAVLRAEGGR
jgi:membrane protein DedA with SNARE-associated domain